MNTNESTLDRIVRAVIALAAGGGALATSGAVSIVLWVVAAIMAVTAAIGFCPLYRVFGISTCPVKTRNLK
ncbi:DUF2892 domain-containing protein [Corynebacterium sp. 13CS0277]|uniref:YgaP family membrane protein n=1 Tax=Corynebacterium sp. 13CS0277 TaxID=2071994 RepID=UPI000D03EFFF|nr:DUF2892 domain-containing protein [Corynebacterium sp. 13CS0277]PRQ11627.1 DUF2892 domain-containing protein [Corynebacterium sp. 13CS0277]